jgi:hypothetical protein
MLLSEFLNKYDYKGSIVLLEGKRDVFEDDKQKLYELGKLLCSNSKFILFRSGNASGEDECFSNGVVSIDEKRLQVITPYSGHRKKANQSYNTIALDTLNMLEEPELIYQSKQNDKMGKLIDKYVAGDRDRNAIKAAYILRDTIKVIGTQDHKAASFGIFYDDLDNPKAGGTGHTIKVCDKNDIP